jgi:hypothetical protein
MLKQVLDIGSFQIDTIEDVPTSLRAAFQRAEQWSPEHLFAFHLPRQKFGGLLRGMSHPARVFRITPNELQVISQPSRADDCDLKRVAIEHILHYETGTSLLKSWLKLTSSGPSGFKEPTYLYAATWDRYFDRLYRELDRLLQGNCHPNAGEGPIPRSWIQQLEYKFASAVFEMIERGEPVLSLVFQPAQYRLRRFSRRCSGPRRCLCLTPRRLVWFDEDAGGECLEYGLVRRVISLRRIESLEVISECSRDERRGGLLVRLKEAQHSMEVPIDLELSYYYNQLIERWKTLRQTPDQGD